MTKWLKKEREIKYLKTSQISKKYRVKHFIKNFFKEISILCISFVEKFYLNFFQYSTLNFFSFCVIIFLFLLFSSVSVICRLRILAKNFSCLLWCQPCWLHLDLCCERTPSKSLRSLLIRDATKTSEFPYRGVVD